MSMKMNVSNSGRSTMSKPHSGVSQAKWDKIFGKKKKGLKSTKEDKNEK